jgi:hypothetical protein
MGRIAQNTTCHPERKHHSKGLCKPCYVTMASRRRYENPEYRKKRAAETRRWYKENKERCYERDFNKHLKRSYGITSADYSKMHDAQNGVCKICKEPETSRTSAHKKINRLAVDHCHKTGKIRGLLCFKCNVALARIEFAGVSAFEGYLNETI